MEDIYLMPKKIKPFNISKSSISIEDIYDVYPLDLKNNIKNIILRNYKNNKSKYDVIHLGEVIELIKNQYPKVHINFLKTDDIVIFFEENKKDKTKYLRIIIVSIVVLMGSIMGIMNFHADVNMEHSQFKMVDSITNDGNKYLGYFQIPYSIGIGLGVALFFNKFIPTYSKDEPSPLDLKLNSLNKDIENEIRKKF